MVVTQLDPISVMFSTPEDNLPRIAGRLNSGAELKVTVLDRANVNALATGTLTTYDSQVDVTTGTIRMRATFANPNGALFPLQFVNVRLLVDTQKGVALAPNAAIQIGPSGNFVYLLNSDGTVSKRDVVSGPTDGKVTTITQGLAAGDRIVIDGVDRLRDGAKVRLADASPETGAPGAEGHAQAGDRSLKGAGDAGPEADRGRRGEGAEAGGGAGLHGRPHAGSKGDLRRLRFGIPHSGRSAGACEDQGRGTGQGRGGQAGQRALERDGRRGLSSGAFAARRGARPVRARSMKARPLEARR